MMIGKGNRNIRISLLSLVIIGMIMWLTRSKIYLILKNRVIETWLVMKVIRMQVSKHRNRVDLEFRIYRKSKYGFKV